MDTITLSSLPAYANPPTFCLLIIIPSFSAMHMAVIPTNLPVQWSCLLNICSLNKSWLWSPPTSSRLTSPAQQHIIAKQYAQKRRCSQVNHRFNFSLFLSQCGREMRSHTFPSFNLLRISCCRHVAKRNLISATVRFLNSLQSDFRIFHQTDRFVGQYTACSSFFFCWSSYRNLFVLHLPEFPASDFFLVNHLLLLTPATDRNFFFLFWFVWSATEKVHQHKVWAIWLLNFPL